MIWGVIAKHLHRYRRLHGGQAAKVDIEDARQDALYEQELAPSDLAAGYLWAEETPGSGKMYPICLGRFQFAHPDQLAAPSEENKSEIRRGGADNKREGVCRFTTQAGIANWNNAKVRAKPISLADLGAIASLQRKRTRLNEKGTSSTRSEYCHLPEIVR